MRKALASPASVGPLVFKVRIFQAKYASNGRILWQVDRGYDERINAECQIVRGEYEFSLSPTARACYSHSVCFLKSLTDVHSVENRRCERGSC